MEQFIILLIGIAFIGLGLFAVWSYIKKRKCLKVEGSEVLATIVEITGMRNNRKAFITYTVAGKEWNVELSYYSNNMKVGDAVRLYVDNQNPQNYAYIGKGPIVTGVLFIIVGIVLPIIWRIN